MLEYWLGRAGRRPLVIRGARQVGKSTLVKLFADQIKVPLAVVNLERHPELNGIFGSMAPKMPFKIGRAHV